MTISSILTKNGLLNRVKMIYKGLNLPRINPQNQQSPAHKQPNKPNIQSTTQKTNSSSTKPNQTKPNQTKPITLKTSIKTPSKMHYSNSIISITAFPLLFTTAATALGINCRGSGLCPRASWNDKSSETIVQALRDAIWTDADANTTTYNNGDHIICVSQSQAITVGGGVNAGVSSGGDGPTANAGVSGTFSLSGSIGEGGICVFPQDLKAGATLDLGTVRGLTNALLEHGCSTCGSVPINFVTEGSNDPGDGILTFNYVANPFCDGSCMSASGTPTNNTKLRREIGDVPKRLARPLFV